MTRAVLGFALGAALWAAPPQPDIVSTGRALAPKGARIVLAQELDATLGVIAYEHRGETTALAMRWADHRWQKARRGSITIRPIEPLPDRTIGRKPFFVRARIRMPAFRGTGRIGLWLDGKQLQPGSYDGRVATDLYVVVEKPAPGRHTVVAYAGGGAYGLALAWSFRIR